MHLNIYHFHFSVADQKLYTALEEIKAQVHFNTKLLYTVIKKSESVTIKAEELPEDIQSQIPITDIEALKKMEDSLKDPENSKMLVSIIFKYFI